MKEKDILKLAAKGRTNCSKSGCPLYDCNYRTNEIYKYLLNEKNNVFSNCSEVFLSLCFRYNKKRTKELFEKYKNDDNFFEEFRGRGKGMPCHLLGEMAKFMLNNKNNIDIE